MRAVVAFFAWPRLAGLAWAALVPALLVVLAVAQGGAGTLATAYLGLGTALALLLVLALAGLAPWPRLGWPATVALLALCGLVVETGLSAFWSGAPAASTEELARSAAYLCLFALGLVAARRLALSVYLGLAAAALVGVALLALASRLFPSLGLETDLSLLPSASDRLSYPIGYWNGLAGLCALSLPLLLALATRLPWRPARGVTLALAVPPLLVVYLASSRGGVLAALVGAVAYLILCRERLLALLELVLVGAGVALSVALVSRYPDVADAVPGRDAHAYAGWLAVILVGVAVLGSLLPRAFKPRPWLERGVAVGLPSAMLVGAGLASPLARLRHFTDAPPTASHGAGYVRAHLLSGSGSGRWQIWQAAVSQFEHHPLVGAGAGAFERYWQAHASLPMFVRDAHSLYLETLAELGLLGLAFLALGLLAVAVAVTGRLRSDRSDRAALAALVALALAFFVSAGFDWLWELPALAAGVFFILGLLAAPVEDDTTETSIAHDSEDEDATPAAVSAAAARWPARALRASAVVCLLALVGFQLLNTASAEQQRRSEQALARGDARGAERAALAERQLEPWSPQPYEQLALIEERTGQLPQAAHDLTLALQHDDGDWRLWLIQARVETKRGQVERAAASLARAEALAPQLPLWSAG